MRFQLAAAAGVATLLSTGHAFPEISNELRREFGTDRVWNNNNSTIHDYLPKGAFALDVERVAHDTKHRRTVKDSGIELVTRAAQMFADRLDNQRFYYSSTVYIGTPPQPVTLLLDTGSSDTWVFTPQTKHRGNKGKPTSFFNPSSSKTFKTNGTSYAIQYGIGQSTGTWGTDVFQIGTAKVRDFSIGIASVGDVSQGIIGIGRPQAEASVKSGVMYENLPLKLQSSGIIHTAAYSLYLNDLNSKSGTILFGAVDHSKYTGPLFAMPISHPKHLGVSFKGLYTDGIAKKNIVGKPMTAVLDSGTSLSYLPSDALGSLHVYLNANPSFAIGEKFYCDCNVTNHLVMDFNGVQVQIPSYHFLWPIESIVNPIVASVAFPPNSCYIGIEETQRGMDFALIGDNFMRAMYIVYDLEHGKIAVAQANLRGATPRVELITDHIPGSFGG